MKAMKMNYGEREKQGLNKAIATTYLVIALHQSQTRINTTRQELSLFGQENAFLL